MENHEHHGEAAQNPVDSDSLTRAQRELGARVLSQANFDSRQKEIVDSSFAKARQSGEKFPGKNNERRNFAYLSRLENLIAKYGNDAEKRLWQASINDDLLIKYENIPESYWQAKKQELRDEGRGNVELDDHLKHELFDKERSLQAESLEKWANYLGDEHSPYPLWFKIYAWDGMTKMGRYSKEEGRYEVRNETTVAPYPEPDAEILAGVFDIMNRYYGNNERQFYTEEGERNIKLEQIVQSGNFPKIFNAIQQDIAPIIEPPEWSEDVHGQWIEYALGDEDDIARAAKGTGWCVASSEVGRHYLEYGTYGNDWDNEGYDDDCDDHKFKAEIPKSRFILFHLNDEITGKLSKNAVASIRLDTNGKVAEISGLESGQALNDSLVPTVEEKVKSLPGGKEFLPKLADKRELIRLDRKMQRNEDLTTEELEFVYEIRNRISTLDTYNNTDPRISELRDHYNEDYARAHGVDPECSLAGVSDGKIIDNLDAYIDNGLDLDKFVSQLEPFLIADHFNTLVEHGAKINIDGLVSRFRPYGIAENLDTLIKHGARIDIDGLVSELDSYGIARNLDTLIKHGAKINPDDYK